MKHEPPFVDGGQWHVTRHADVRAVLADPGFAVPEPPGGPAADRAQGMSWLRASVSRFSNGEEHARRRSRSVASLAAIDPALMRQEAFDLATAEFRAADSSGGVDVMALLARRVPVGVLATHLGVPAACREEAVAAVTTIAAAYHPRPGGTDDDPGDDPAGQAVDVLAELLGDPAPDHLATVAGLLVQACDATAGLIGNALNIVTRLPSVLVTRWPAEAVLAETLRYEPPVRLTRRVAGADTLVGGAVIPAGAVVVLDLAAAGRDPDVFRDPHRFDPDRHLARSAGADPSGAAHLGFGSGLRPCPGDVIAIALAAGVLDATRGLMLADPRVAHEPSPNLRVPSRLCLEAAFVSQMLCNKRLTDGLDRF
jgi:cytochrome P450